MTTFDRVKDSIVSALQCDEEIITLEASISEDLGADSLDLVELVMALEDEFDMKIADEQTKAIKTVADIVTLIDSGATA